MGAAGSIIGIAAFGLKFATTLQTYIEAVFDAQQSLQDIASDVSATASALEQLHEIVKVGENGKAIANNSGLHQVIQLASQCKQVYIAIINLIARATGVPKDDDGNVSLDALDLDSLKATSLMRKLKWPFKEPRIKKHQDNLRWLKLSLLFHLRLMELAKSKMSTPAKALNADEREAALEFTLEKLLRRREAYAKNMALQRKMQESKGKRVTSHYSSSSSRSDTAAPSGFNPFLQLNLSASESPDFENPRSPPVPPPGRSSWFIDGDDKTEAKTPPTSPPPLSADDIEKGGFDLNSRPPEPPEVKPIPHSKFIAKLAVMPPMNQSFQNTEKQDNDTSPIQKQMHQTPTNRPTPLQTFSNTQGAASNSTSSDNKKEIPHGRTLGPPRSTQPPKSSRSTSGTLSWLSSLFRKREKFTNDRESSELEAWLIESDSFTMRKLPFGHQKLTSMLKRTTKSRRGDIWAHYTALTPNQREAVNRATTQAHRSSRHARTCVAISAHPGRNSYIVVFFSLGLPVQPVHLKMAGRYFQFTFELCRTWEGMDELVKEALGSDMVIGPAILQGQYQLRGLDDHEILPVTWSSTVQPGLVVFLIPRPVSFDSATSVLESAQPVQLLERQSESLILSLPNASRMKDMRERSAPPSGFELKVDRSARRFRRGFVSTKERKPAEYPGNPDLDLNDPEPAIIHPEIGAEESNARASRAMLDLQGAVHKESRPAYQGTRNSVREAATMLMSRGASSSQGESSGEEEEEEEEEADIIDFEQEQENARLGLGDLLGRWTNVFDTSASEEPQRL